MVFVGIAIFVCLGVMGTLVVTSIEDHFQEQDADELDEVFHAIKLKLEKSHNQSVQPSKLLFQAVSGHHGVYYYVEDAEGDTIFSSEGADFSFFPKTAKTYTSINPADMLLFSDENHMHRAIKLGFNTHDTSYTIIVASNMEFHMTFMNSLLKSIIGIIICSGIITVLAARFAIYRSLSPLRKLTRKIETITADNLDIRLNPDEVPEELITLVNSFNTMIERLEDGFEKLSHFSADIAHELRTPITSLTTQTQVMLGQARSNDEYAEILYSNLEEYERMTKMVSDMLLLAKTEHGLIKPSIEPLDIQQEISSLLDYFNLLADEKHINIQVTASALTIQCDKTMFRQAIGNLISNAIRHAPSNSTVEIKTESKGKKQKIMVLNNGEKIEPQHIPKLFNRFYRVDPSRQRDGQGTGLGLTIAKSVMKINGADMYVESDESKTVFIIEFSDT
jgi:two-component system heavy metal sensor histidine kinase CusS